MPTPAQRPASDAVNVAAHAAEIDDRVTDWLEEIERVARSAASLRPAARTAVLTVLASFELEDGMLASPALRARAALNSAPVPPNAPHLPPARIETLLDVLVARLHPRPSQQPARTAA